MTQRNRCFWMAACLLTLSLLTAADAQTIADARKEAMGGEYANAVKTLSSLDDSIDAADLFARVRLWTGEYELAEQELRAAVKTFPKSAQLKARLAEALFLSGNYDDAKQSCIEALKLDANHLLGRWIDAELKAETGQLKDALNGYVWFVRYYNRAQPDKADDLVLIARGSLQYARWRSSSQIFSFVVNTLCPDALEDDSSHWPAMVLSGETLAEKYNRDQAEPEYDDALEVNPSCAEAIALQAELEYSENNEEEANALADKALEINPRLLRAHWLKADLRLEAGDVPGAQQILNTALKFNPREQRTLGRLAGIAMLSRSALEVDALAKLLKQLETVSADDVDTDDTFTSLLLKVVEWNRHPGPFLFEAGQVVERRRRYGLAEQFYAAAMQTMPQLSAPKTALGMLYLRTGRHEKARTTLDAAFKLDPYHVRVSNMRKVLKVLDGYDTITTDHFVIHVDSTLDRVLGQYMAEFLEEAHDDLAKRFDFEPPARTHFEIYNRAKGRSGHEWFSTRMVGLPWIQTIGASTGVIVALTSPTASAQNFNWARVLRHEYIHVLTLQQTKFNIPHWFTEALAVSFEGGIDPEQWADLLLDRVPRGELKSLDELNYGFTRPESPDDWQFAYCQSRLYAKYMQRRFGAEIIPKLLESYRKNIPTNQGIAEATGVTIEDFEQGYRKFLRDLVTDLNGGTFPEVLTLQEHKKRHEKSPRDNAIAAAYALALWENGNKDDAVELADKVLDREPRNQVAALVIGRYLRGEEEEGSTLPLMLDAVDEEAPDRLLLEEIIELAKEEKDFEVLEEIGQLGMQHYPWRSTWSEGLVMTYLQKGNREKLKPALERLAELKSDSAAVRKLRAEIAAEESDWKTAFEWCTKAVHIDVTDASLHELFGEAAVEIDDQKAAEREYKVALELDPTLEQSRLGLATLYQSQGKRDEALSQVNELLKHHPGSDAGKTLKEKLQ